VGPLDSSGELIAAFTLDGLHLRVQQTSEQPLHHYVPLVAHASNSSNTGAPRRLSPVSSSVLMQLYTVVEASVAALQLDNHLEAELPVVLFSFQDKQPPHGAVPSPALNFVFVSSAPVRVGSHRAGPTLLSSASLLRAADLHLLSLTLSPLAVNVEDEFLFRLLAVGMDLGQRVARLHSANTSTTRALSEGATAAQQKPVSFRSLVRATTNVPVAFVARIEQEIEPRFFVHYLFISDLDLRSVPAQQGTGMCAGGLSLLAR